MSWVKRDPRIEKLGNDLEAVRNDLGKVKGLGAFREEEHMRITTCLQNTREDAAALRSITSNLQETVNDRPTRTELKTSIDAIFEPFRAEVSTRLDILDQSIKNVSIDLNRSEKRWEAAHAEMVQSAASKVPLPQAKTPGIGEGVSMEVDRIVEQVEARLFRRIEKMVNDRVELAKLRMEEKVMKKIDVLTEQIRGDVKKAQHKGLLSEQTLMDEQQKKQMDSMVSNRTRDQAKLEAGMKQVGSEQKLMQNSLISLRTQVRALARVVTGLRGEVTAIQEERLKAGPGQ